VSCGCLVKCINWVHVIRSEVVSVENMRILPAMWLKIKR